jgi:hypothetical protein
VGGPLRESNWKRSVGWSAATAAVGLRGFRVHDLRHTVASVWLGARAEPKVVQRVLGHATASMTMDLYGHLVDANLWEAARAIGGILGHLSRPINKTRTRTMRERTKVPGRGGFWVEPPIGIEPMTYALRGGVDSSTAVQLVTSALLVRLLGPPVSGIVQGRC